MPINAALIKFAFPYHAHCGHITACTVPPDLDAEWGIFGKFPLTVLYSVAVLYSGVQCYTVVRWGSIPAGNTWGPRQQPVTSFVLHRLLISHSIRRPDMSQHRGNNQGAKDEWVGDEWVGDEWAGEWVGEWVGDEWVGDEWVGDEWAGEWVREWVGDEWVGDEWVGGVGGRG